MAAASPHAKESPRWLPAGMARDLVWWDAAALADLSAELARAARAWGAAWGVDTTALRTVAAPVEAVPDIEPGSASLRCRGAPVGWACGEGAARTALLHCLFAELPSTADLARHVTAECHADALQRLAVVLGAELAQDDSPAPIAGADARKVSGVLQVRFEGVPIADLLLAGAGTQVWRARRALARGPRMAEHGQDLCAPAAALRWRQVAMHVELAGCELDLATLQALQVGDVLRLRHGLRDPATICDDTGTRLFSGHLAQRRGAVALELIPLQA